jgi:hypothetical protein
MRRARIVAGATAAAAVALLAAGTATGAGAAPRSAPAGHVADPNAIYFRHDAVGGNMQRLAVSSTSCGTERWPVKTLTDYDRGNVDLNARRASIRYLRGRNRPAVSFPTASRVAPVELTTYKVHARLVKYVHEDDNDYHLVLASHGLTMVVEIPAPACVGKISPVKDRIRRARRKMDARYSVTTAFKDTDQRVVVTGIGFWDYLHGQTGMAPNGIELHPVIGLRFR